VAVVHLDPRIAKGSIVAFDEPNCPEFPAETRAPNDTIEGRPVELGPFRFEPHISHFMK
jgi:hypothetical protein